MRGLCDHEVVENALAMSIMDLRPCIRAIAGDEVTRGMLKEDLALLRKIVEEVEASK